MRVTGVILIVFGLLLCLTIVGAFFGVPMFIIGIVLVAMGGRKTVITNVVTVQTAPGSKSDFDMRAGDSGFTPSSARPQPSFPRASIEAIQGPIASYDKSKWQTLVKYDDDLRNAAARVRPFGDVYEDELAEAYLAVNDKTYLESIVKKVVQDAQINSR